MPDVLDIVVVFHGVQHLFHLLALLFVVQLLIVLRNHLNLSRDEGILLGDHGISHGVEVIGIGVDGEYIILCLEIIGTAVHSVHHDIVFLVFFLAVVDDQHALLIEAPGHAAAGTQIAAEFVEVVAHVACGTVTAVGHGLHDNSNTAGAVAFVGDGFVIVAAAGTGSLLQAALNIVVWHVGSFCLGDNGGQAGVVGGIGNAAAFLNGYDELFCDLGECSGALSILRTFSFLNVMPLGMSGHWYTSLL